MAKYNWNGPIYNPQERRYYMYTESGGEKHILDSDDKRGLEFDYQGNLSSGGYHDHFFTKRGLWYVVSRLENDNFFDENGGERADSDDFLNGLFDELKTLDS